MKIRLFSLAVMMLALLMFFACSSGEDDADDDSDNDGQNNFDDDEAADDDDDQNGADDDDEGPETLLDRFMPFVIQSLADDYELLPYEETSDLMGGLWMGPGNEEFEYFVHVNTNKPVMYSTQRTAIFGEKEYKQLIYAYFYPDRPIPILFVDHPIEFNTKYLGSGLVDGKVIRITLDEGDNVPLLIEVARNCGCDWKLYVNKIVDDHARAEFESQDLEYPGLVKSNAPHDVQYVWTMPEDLAGADSRPVVIAEEGWSDYPHMLLGVFTSLEQWENNKYEIGRGIFYQPEGTNTKEAPDALSDAPYKTADYDDLYLMSPDGINEIGIFDSHHYIWNSYPPWACWNCWSPNAEFPGTPRDLEYLEVVHETMDYWAVEELIGRFIHLPSSLF